MKNICLPFCFFILQILSKHRYFCKHGISSYLTHHLKTHLNISHFQLATLRIRTLTGSTQLLVLNIGSSPTSRLTCFFGNDILYWLICVIWGKRIAIPLDLGLGLIRRALSIYSPWTKSYIKLLVTQEVIQLGLSLASGFVFEYYMREEMTPKSGKASFEIG